MELWVGPSPRAMRRGRLAFASDAEARAAWASYFPGLAFPDEYAARYRPRAPRQRRRGDNSR